MIQTDNELTVVDMPDVEQAVTDPQGFWKALEGLSFDDAISKISNSLIDFAFKLMIAILVFYVGKFVIRKLFNLVKNLMVNRRVDASLTTFVLSLVKMVLYFILIITVIGILGIETSSFIAIFASAGVAIGMALSGTLQNFAGGVLILLLKPYRVGDFIEAGGYTGTVKAIQIFHTIINTTDNKAIIIPNGGLSTGSINNYSLEQYRRVDWTIGLSYGNDFDKAKEAILAMLLEDKRVVVRYTEDDMERREAEALQAAKEAAKDAPVDCEEHPEDEACREEVKKMSWWKRIRIRRKKHLAKVEKELLAKEALNAGLPVKVERPPFIGLDQLADSSINIVVRAWTHASNYWPLYYEMNRRFYTELPGKGFSFPFPQMDVHLDYVGNEK